MSKLTLFIILFLIILIILYYFYCYNSKITKTHEKPRNYLQFIGWLKNNEEAYFLYFHQKKGTFLIKKDNEDFLQLQHAKIHHGDTITLNNQQYTIILDK